MITVTFSHKDNDYSVSINGHAGYSKSGDDIVCAAASTLGYTLMGFLENCTAVKDLKTTEGIGGMEISCKGVSEAIKTAFDMAVIGFLQLKKAYPRYINIDYSEYL